MQKNFIHRRQFLKASILASIVTALPSIAIAAKNKEILCQKPVSPCGICRQVLLESEKRAGKPIRIILGSKGTVRIFESVKDLLPFGFDSF